MSKKRDIDRTYDDSIVAEIHKTRHKILAQFGNDVDAYMNFVARRRIPGVKYVDTRHNGKKGFTYPTLDSSPTLADVPCACESPD